MELADGEGEHGCGAVGFEEEDFETVSGEDGGGDAGEADAVIAGIAGDDDGAVGDAGGAEVDGHSVGGFGDGAVIDGGGAHFAHGATSSAGSEGDGGVEHGVECGPVLLLDEFFEAGFPGLEGVTLEPGLDVLGGVAREESGVGGGGDGGSEIGCHAEGSDGRALKGQLGGQFTSESGLQQIAIDFQESQRPGVACTRGPGILGGGPCI